jgi:hypothetical protein
MNDHEDERAVVDRFLLEQIETVPHLEVLLLLWTGRPRAWSVNEMAKALFLTPEPTRDILDNLARKRLIVSEGEAGTIATCSTSVPTLFSRRSIRPTVTSWCTLPG